MQRGARCAASPLRGKTLVSRLLCRALALVLAALAPLLAGAASPSAAHPFGDPQTVEVEATSEPTEVRVRWRAGGADDLTLLAISLGALPQDRVMLDGAVWFEDGDADALAAAPRFADYLLDRIGVASGAIDCPGAVTGTDLLGAGATLVFTCPAPVETATVDVRTLLDLHPAYRALATGPDGQRAVYDQDVTSHDWTFAGHPSGSVAAPASAGRSAAAQLGTIGGIALAAVVAGLLWYRRRGRRA
jgi:hypothetical protein